MSMTSSGEFYSFPQLSVFSNFYYSFMTKLYYDIAVYTMFPVQNYKKSNMAVAQKKKIKAKNGKVIPQFVEMKHRKPKNGLKYQ